MLDILFSIAAFIVAIGVLVAVHEFGHFWVARRLGFKVLRFSIGFGRPLARWREPAPQEEGPRFARVPGAAPVPSTADPEWSQVSPPTEYWISSIPLGGYVKLLDEREGPAPIADLERAFNRRPIPHRVAVLLAGPGFNFLFAILAYWLMFVTGVPGMRAIIGDVAPGSIAAEAGLEPNQEITAVGGDAKTSWEGVVLGILDELLADGVIDLTVVDSGGVQRDVVLDIRGRESQLTEPDALFVGLGFGPGILPEAILGELTPGLPAEAAGLQPGDRVTRLAGEEVRYFDDLVEIVRSRPGELAAIVVERDGREFEFGIQIGETIADDGSGEIQGIIGAAVSLGALNERRAAAATTEYYGVLEAFPKGIAKTWEMSALTVRMLGRMIIGDVSVRNISGPINIAAYAGDSAQAGLGAFLGFLAIVSISLGVLNLLPVPLLDGGQIVYQLAEAVKGAPLSERALIFGQQVGLLLLVVLMSFAFYNDLSRFFS
ncbi:MAG TPA: RIP metalloprotease RseP [Gammaproteobacteria bacterium]